MKKLSAKKLVGLLVYISKLVKAKLFSKNISIGKTTRIKNSAEIKNLKIDNRYGQIDIKPHCSLYNNSSIIARGGNVIIEDGCNINYNFKFILVRVVR